MAKNTLIYLGLAGLVAYFLLKNKTSVEASPTQDYSYLQGDIQRQGQTIWTPPQQMGQNLDKVTSSQPLTPLTVVGTTGDVPKTALPRLTTISKNVGKTITHTTGKLSDVAIVSKSGIVTGTSEGFKAKMREAGYAV